MSHSISFSFSPSKSIKKIKHHHLLCFYFSDNEKSKQTSWSILSYKLICTITRLEHTDTLSYPITCVLPLLPQLTSTVGVSGGLSNFLSFTFLSFLPGRPSSPLINSLKKTDIIIPLSRVLNKKQLYSTPKWLTCDSNSSAWTSHSPVFPHLHSPRMPGHKASPATWSSSGHGPSCPHCNVKERNPQSQKATLLSSYISLPLKNCQQHMFQTDLEVGQICIQSLYYTGLWTKNYL